MKTISFHTADFFQKYFFQCFCLFEFYQYIRQDKVLNYSNYNTFYKEPPLNIVVQ